MSRNLELVGNRFQPYNDELHVIEGLVFEMDDEARLEAYGEESLPNPCTTQLAPIYDDTDGQTTFHVSSWHETSGPDVEFPAVTQEHEFSFIPQLHNDDMIAVTETGNVHTLTTRQSLYVTELIRMALHDFEIKEAVENMEPISREWPFPWQPPV